MQLYATIDNMIAQIIKNISTLIPMKFAIYSGLGDSLHLKTKVNDNQIKIRIDGKKLLELVVKIFELFLWIIYKEKNRIKVIAIFETAGVAKSRANARIER